MNSYDPEMVIERMKKAAAKANRGKPDPTIKPPKYDIVSSGGGSFDVRLERVMDVVSWCAIFLFVVVAVIAIVWGIRLFPGWRLM